MHSMILNGGVITLGNGAINVSFSRNLLKQNVQP